MSSTKYCRKCRMEIDRKATKCPYCGSSQGLSCSGMIGAFIFVIAAIFILSRFGGSTPETSSNQSNASTTTSSTTSETSITAETENPDIIWLDRKLGLFLSKKTEKGSTQDGYITITGAVGNGSLNNYSYVAINFTIRDKKGLKVGDAFDNISGLKSGDAWSFKATGFADNAASYEFESITAW